MYILWKKKSFFYLSEGKKKISGRNNQGKLMLYHRGGGVKRKYRIIDYFRFIWNVYALIYRLEFDPNRNSLIALILYTNGIFSYIISTQNLKVGQKIINRNIFNFLEGYSLYMKYIVKGTKICNIEKKINKGIQLIRTAGNFAILYKKLKKYIILKIKKNKKIRFLIINNKCIAVIGQVSYFEYMYKIFYKAGYFRLKGWRPHVRGVAMNPIDHPHGGGQGKTSGGRSSVTPWGIITKGKPTVKKKNYYI